MKFLWMKCTIIIHHKKSTSHIEGVKKRIKFVVLFNLGVTVMSSGWGILGRAFFQVGLFGWDFFPRGFSDISLWIFLNTTCMC